MGAKIKVCGLRRSEDIEYAAKLMPDYAGFVFAPSSRRYVDPRAAAQLIEKLPCSIQSVGVFTSADPEEILSAAKESGIQIIQLHGLPEDALIKAVQTAGYPVIQAYSVSGAEDIEKANASPADYVLLDQGKGGSGKRFDWSLLDQMQREYFLAGGIGPDNAKEALQRYAPYALDASSSLETDGIKDFEKMRQLIETVRNIQADPFEKKEDL